MEEQDEFRLTEVRDIDDTTEEDYVPVQWTREELNRVAEGYREVWENIDLPEEECPF